MDIIDLLEQYRLENRITQPQLAKELNVAYATINRWLTRRFKPSKIQRHHIEKFLAKKAKIAIRSGGIE